MLISCLTLITSIVYRYINNVKWYSCGRSWSMMTSFSGRITLPNGLGMRSDMVWEWGQIWPGNGVRYGLGMGSDMAWEWGRTWPGNAVRGIITWEQGGDITTPLFLFSSIRVCNKKRWFFIWSKAITTTRWEWLSLIEDTSMINNYWAETTSKVPTHLWFGDSVFQKKKSNDRKPGMQWKGVNGTVDTRQSLLRPRYDFLPISAPRVTPCPVGAEVVTLSVSALSVRSMSLVMGMASERYMHGTLKS